MKASRVLTVLALTAGAMTMSAPAFANDGGTATVCDTALTSVEPGGCVSVAEWTPRGVEYPFFSSEFCTGDQPLVPTVTELCYYGEIDTPYQIVAQAS